MDTQHATPGTESVALQSMPERTGLPVQFIKTKLRAMQPVFTEQCCEGSITGHARNAASLIGGPHLGRHARAS